MPSGVYKGYWVSRSVGATLDAFFGIRRLSEVLALSRGDVILEDGVIAVRVRGQKNDRP